MERKNHEMVISHTSLIKSDGEPSTLLITGRPDGSQVAIPFCMLYTPIRGLEILTYNQLQGMQLDMPYCIRGSSFNGAIYVLASPVSQIIRRSIAFSLDVAWK